jgi:hypothetical protein
VEDGLAADAPVQQGVEGGRRLVPRTLEFHLAVKSSVGTQCAQALEVPRPAAMPGELVEQVECVDRRALRAVEPRRAEGEGFVVALRPDIDDDAARGARCSIASPKVAPPTASMIRSNSPAGCATTSRAPRRDRTSRDAYGAADVVVSASTN